MGRLSATQRFYVGIAPIVPLATWPGFSTVSGIPFRHVEVWYVLAENQVTVFKAGKEAAYYTLS